MRRRRRGAVACLLAGFLAACSGPRGHRILTFFFDGVPPLKTASESAVGGRPGEIAAGPATVRRGHGPYAAKMCDACHEQGRGNVLVVPADQLCVRCHDLGNGKKYVHGPINAGGCLVCHDPHASPNPWLLVSASDEFCLRCHDRRTLLPVEGHETSGQACTACHDAHMSDNRYLLR